MKHVIRNTLCILIGLLMIVYFWGGETKILAPINTDLGNSKSSISNTYDEESDMKLLGGALPIKSYRTLADAENAFGYYLGFHNTIKIEDITYNLVSMHIIDTNIMMGTFEVAGTESIGLVVKTSKVAKVEDLAKVYLANSNYDYKITTYKGIKIDKAYKEENLINLAYFNHESGKAYTLYNQAGLHENHIDEIIKQLIDNLNLMED